MFIYSWSSENVKQEVITRNWTYDFPLQWTYDLRKCVSLGRFKRLFIWVFIDLMILELVNLNLQHVDLNSQLVDLNSHFWIWTRAFKFSTRNSYFSISRYLRIQLIIFFFFTLKKIINISKCSIFNFFIFFPGL